MPDKLIPKAPPSKGQIEASEKPTKAAKVKTKKAARDENLGAALRANLKRRKQSARNMSKTQKDD